MNANAHGADHRARCLEEVQKLVRAKVAPEWRATLEKVVPLYFERVDPEDLAERAPADLYGAVLSHWNFARKREPGRAKVRVFNPAIDEHGWASTHTIIEIVNDDMPFLVDSVTMAANRDGLTLHLIVHPILAVTRGADGTLTGLARTSAALVAAIAEARVRIKRGDVDDDSVELLRHARELYEIMRETLIADPAAGEYAPGLLESIENNLDQLEEAMRDGRA